MVALKWEEWLPIEGCIKSDGSEITWFINRTRGKKWYLARARQLGNIFNLKSVGLYRTLEEAMDYAEKLETTGVL